MHTKPENLRIGSGVVPNTDDEVIRWSKDTGSSL